MINGGAKRSTAATKGDTKMNDATNDDNEPWDDATTTEIDNKTNSSTRGDNSIKRNLWGMNGLGYCLVRHKFIIRIMCGVLPITTLSQQRLSNAMCIRSGQSKRRIVQEQSCIDFVEQAQGTKKRARQDRNSSGEGEKGILEEDWIEWSKQDLIEMENGKLLEDMKRRLAEFE